MIGKWQRMLNRSDMSGKIGIAGIVLLALMLGLAVLGPLLVPYDASERTGPPLMPPGGGHVLGTNDIGQDILAELVAGARVSLSIGLVGALLVMLIGTAIGLIAGYFSGWIDTLLMRLVDITMTLPFLPLMIVIGVFLGPSWTTLVLVIALAMWARIARQTRSQIMSLRSRGHVLAARSMGATDLYVLFKHIFPGIVPLMIPQFIHAVNAAIMMESSLSFLGLGDPLTKSWGSMLYYANSRSAFLTDAWTWWVLPAGLCIVVTVLGFSFIGYWLEERVSPRLRQVYRKPANKKPKQAANASSDAVRLSAKPQFDKSKPIIEVDRLTVAYPKDGSTVKALSDVSFAVLPGEVVGVVGESGSGKSTVAAAIMQLLKPPADVLNGQVRLYGCDLAALAASELRKQRGSRIALIPQAAMNALNPVLKIRDQLAEAVLCHRPMNRRQLNNRIDEILSLVGLSARWGAAYPHELSGGMKQRVVIAMALINEPEFVIADEPTTGLDVLVQVEIIQLLQRLQKQLSLSMIFISHDLSVVLRLANRVVLLNKGELVDQGTTHDIAYTSTHPYTRKLIDSIPRLHKPDQQLPEQQAGTEKPVLEVIG
ncbi:MAG: transporter [Paenibacillus sp.]|nr:transporter [Paenibacillus sp.]